MLLKKIHTQDIAEVDAILPIIKIEKTIEIIIVPNSRLTNNEQANIGFVIDEEKILRILTEGYQNVSITEINCEENLEELVKRKPDLVFSGVKYFFFENRNVWLNEYLDKFGISYIASGKESLDNEFDKSVAKIILQKEKIKTADFFITNPGEHLTEKSIPIDFPLFIKPLTGGDSIGIDENSIVFNFKSYTEKVLDIKQNQNSSSLVETYLAGNEYSVGILENSFNGIITAMPIEIIVEKNLNGHRILDFDVKRNDIERVIFVNDAKIFNKLSKMAIDSFRALGGKSMGRIDIKMDNLDVPHFIEANFMPGLSEGYFYKSCQLNLGISYEEMIYIITNNGLISVTKNKVKSPKSQPINLKSDPLLQN